MNIFTRDFLSKRNLHVVCILECVRLYNNKKVFENFVDWTKSNVLETFAITFNRILYMFSFIKKKKKSMFMYFYMSSRSVIKNHQLGHT